MGDVPDYLKTVLWNYWLWGVLAGISRAQSILTFLFPEVKPWFDRHPLMKHRLIATTILSIGFIVANYQAYSEAREQTRKAEALFKTSQDETAIEQGLTRWYAEAGERIHRLIPPNDPRALAEYIDDNKKWLFDCSEWVRLTLGAAGQARLLTSVDLQLLTSRRSVDIYPHEMATILRQTQDNLIDLMEHDTWKVYAPTK